MCRSLPILLALLLCRCDVLPQYPLRSHALNTVEASELPLAADIAPEATTAKWHADPARLLDDVARAAERSEWALLEITAAREAGPDKDALPLRAEALLPDNRVAVIHAWAVGEKEVAAAVMIGRFGDRKVQERFLQMLADTLADKPKPKRGGGFELPCNCSQSMRPTGNFRIAGGCVPPRAYHLSQCSYYAVSMRGGT